MPAIRPLLVSVFSPSIRSLGGYIKSFISNASTHPTHSSSSSTAKLKTAGSNKSHQHYDDDTKLTGISIHERPLVDIENTAAKFPPSPQISESFSEKDARARSSSNGNNDNDTNSDNNNNKLRIEMRQTIELTTLNLSPEEQTQSLNDRVLPASLR